MKKKTKKTIETKCDLCDYVWDYSGKAKFYATCPQCLRKVKLTICAVKRKNVKAD